MYQGGDQLVDLVPDFLVMTQSSLQIVHYLNVAYLRIVADAHQSLHGQHLYYLKQFYIR